MTPIDSLRAALQEDNVRAFLMMIRHGEGTSDGLGYSRMFGGAQFDSFTDHPRKAQTYKMGKTGKTLTSTAAGAYQFLSRTWDGLVKQYGFTDFTPESQDLGAIALIKGRGALPDVIAGNFEAAVSKCNKEWASLPGSPYGQPVVTMDKAKDVYIAAGGFSTFDDSTPKKEPAMGPFVLPAISAVISLLPELGKLFGSGSEVASRNVKAVELVVETAKSAIGARNEQELVEAIKDDPEAAKSVKAAVQAVWYELQEMGGGVEAARKANAELTDKAAHKNPALWVTAAILPLVYLVVSAVLFREGWTDEIKMMVVTAILTGVLGGVTGYWLGTSSSSARKTELAQK
jgi:muramidase (phage lysozyme)